MNDDAIDLINRGVCIASRLAPTLDFLCIKPAFRHAIAHG